MLTRIFPAQLIEPVVRGSISCAGTVMHVSWPTTVLCDRSKGRCFLDMVFGYWCNTNSTSCNMAVPVKEVNVL